jgi:hypothetical protein
MGREFEVRRLAGESDSERPDTLVKAVRTEQSPAALALAFERPSDVVLLVIALVSAASSIAALLLHAAGWVAMPYAISYVTLPGMLVLLCVLVWVKVVNRRLLLNRLLIGTIGGVLGLLAYDVGRWLIQTLFPLDFDAFRPILSFGSLITGDPVTSLSAAAAGWAYHISNGLTFALVYALVAGPARWWYGLIWGGILEVGMILVYPVLFSQINYEPFLVVSIVGHVLYGSVLGLCCERYAMRGVS